MTPKYLDPQLRELVRGTVSILGKVIQRNVGRTLYNKIEFIRKEMTLLRKGSHINKMARLEKIYTLLEGLTQQEQFYVAHSFALMLETMNTCENAYRTYVIKKRKPRFHEDRVDGIFYVLTAHPTEARSPENIAIFSELQSVLVESFETFLPWHQDAIQSVIEKAWHTSITRQRKPQVSDEAEYIYSMALNSQILNALIRANDEVAPLFLRSWVGGDKDGHPGVNADTMARSLSQSRRRILLYLFDQIKRIDGDLSLLKNRALQNSSRQLKKSLQVLRIVKDQDGKKIARLKSLAHDFFEEYRLKFGVLLPAMSQIERLFKIFPALVIPLELREASDLIEEAAATKNLTPISTMLSQLETISAGENPRWYVRGLIISMCSSMTHIQAGLDLVRRFFREPKLPVIPLFEQESALKISAPLVNQMLTHPFIRRGIKNYWENRLEIMLGYSDSAKEVGSLQSRLLISETVIKIESLCSKAGVKPVFFHGSGGSVDRGGGSIQEQTAWLSKNGLNLFKATIQGEMVERTFSSPEIFRSGVDKLAEQISRAYHSPRRKKGVISSSKTLHEFAAEVSSHYKSAIASKEFLEVVQRATPYRFLSALKLGSRPSRRGKVTNVLNLRAIPWVLCWTQTRSLFPVWWGTGSAWKKATPQQKKLLKSEFKNNPLFRSYVKVLGFTLAKVELPIWEMYLRKSGMEKLKVELLSQSFRKEYAESLRFLHEVTGENSLLWYRPWLEESIQLRSPMIHPLNLLQMIIMKKANPVMMRETVAGIATGMLTTG